MIHRPRSPRFWLLWLIAIVALGILSRVIHTGFLTLDKYLGDALYAAMVYALLRLRWRARAVPLYAMAIMIVIELFQLSGIPANMAASDQLVTRICARLLGTEFSFLDLLAYGVGILCLYAVDAAGKPGQAHQ